MQQFARLYTDKGVVPAILKGQQPLDLRPIVSDITADALAGGALANVDTSRLSPVPGEFTYLAPIEGIRQIAATGFNYKKHIEEFHMKQPTEPEVFLKGIGSLAGPFDPISRGPNKGVKLDWDGAYHRHRPRGEGHHDRGGGCPHLWLRLSQRRLGPGDPGRCGRPAASGARQIAADHCPIGPYLTTGVDGMNLNMWTKLNGQFEQQGNTNDMLFNVYEMVAYFSTHMVLYPGDLIATGTPPGVGFGKSKFMAVGDVLECGIEHLGAQRHEIRA